jgi:LysM repeat protein
MSENRTSNQLPRGGKPTEAWRVERMVQRVPGHLGEESRLSPWLVVIAVGVIVLVGALLLLFTQMPGGSGNAGVVATSTPRARTTIIRITATPAATRTSTPPPTLALIKYTVKQGDTLSTIARQFKISVEAVRAANHLTSDTIHPGDVLDIPQPSPATTPGALALDTGGPIEASLAPTDTPPAFRTPTLIPFQQTATPATPTTPTPTPGVVPYTVKTGDSLISIAAVFSTTVQAIMTLNQLDGPNIRAGQVLTVPVGQWTATPTPTTYLPPTETPTPQFAYAAPDLLYPSPGADFAHNADVTLQWTSPGEFTNGEFYVVHLSYQAKGVVQNLSGIVVNEGTSYTLDPSLYPSGATAPVQFWWYVVVVRGSGCGPASPAAVQPCAVSPVSDQRSFTWR